MIHSRKMTTRGRLIQATALTVFALGALLAPWPFSSEGRSINAGLVTAIVDSDENSDSGSGSDISCQRLGDKNRDSGGGGEDHDANDRRWSAGRYRGDDTSELIEGTSRKDIIEAGAGDDRVFGRNGNDQLFGGDGNDVLDGDEDRDALSGDGGDDILYWDLHDLMIAGGDGIDTLRVDKTAADLNGFAGTLSGIEVIEMRYDYLGTDLTLSARTILEISSDSIVRVMGNHSDYIDAGPGWTDKGLDGSGFRVLVQDVNGITATLRLNPEIRTNADLLN